MLENADGHAASETVLQFDDTNSPLTGSYSGPNVSAGHLLVQFQGDRTRMLYHALSDRGELVAGEAEVLLTESGMQLNWHWVSGGEGSGISLWRKIN